MGTEHTNSRAAWVALCLCAVAGYVDAAGFLALREIFTSHMSGNTVTTAAYLSRRQWHDALRHGMPIIAFIFGIISGSVIEIAAARRKVALRFSMALAVEIALMSAFIVFVHGREVPQGDAAWAAMLLATAMGMQSVTLRRARGQLIQTAYVSGTLTIFGEQVAEEFFYRRDRARGRLNPTQDKSHLPSIFLHGGLVLVFGVGAIGGGMGFDHFGIKCLLLPVATLLAVLLFDLTRLRR